MPRFALRLALSLAFAIAGTPSVGLAQTTPPAPPVAATQFDYYVMTLSWAPGFCDLGGQETSSSECAEGSGDGFVVHGLWPNNEYRPNPEACRARTRRQPISTMSMASTRTIDLRPTSTANMELAPASARRLFRHRAQRARPTQNPRDVPGAKRSIAHGARRDRAGLHVGQPQSAPRQHGGQLQQRRTRRRSVLPGEGPLVLRRVPQGCAPQLPARVARDRSGALTSSPSPSGFSPVVEAPAPRVFGFRPEFHSGLKSTRRTRRALAARR